MLKGSPDFLIEDYASLPPPLTLTSSSQQQPAVCRETAGSIIIHSWANNP